MLIGDTVVVTLAGDPLCGQRGTVVYLQNLLGHDLPIVRVRFADGVEYFLSGRDVRLSL